MTENVYESAVEDGNSERDFRNLAPSIDGAEWSRTSPLGNLAVEGDTVRVSVWSGAPGTYGHDGATAGEAFVVISGHGSIDIDGIGTHELRPGVVVVVPPRTSSALTVVEDLRKVAFISGTPLHP